MPGRALLKQKSAAVANPNFEGGVKRSLYGTDIDFDMAKKLGARTLDKPFALQKLLDLIDELLN